MIRLRPYTPGDRAAVKTVFYRAVHEGAAGHYTAAQRAAWAPDPAVDPAQPDRLAGQFCLLSESAGAVVAEGAATGTVLHAEASRATIKMG